MTKIYNCLSKRTSYVAILLFTLFLKFLSSCSEEKGFSPLFREVEAGISADSLDVAMAILDSIEKKNNKRESDRMEAAFLELQINDRLYRQHRSDSAIKTLLRYYIDGNRNPSLHPSLLYYAGRVYSDLGRDSRALEYFYRAMNLLAEHPDIDLEGRVCAQIGNIMTRHRLYRKAIPYLKRQRECDFQKGDTLWAFKAGATIAYLYRALNHKDSATMIYRELSKALPTIRDSVTASVYTSQVASFLLDEKRYAEARKLIGSSDLKWDKSTSPSILSILSRLEWEEGNYGRVRELAGMLIADSDPHRQRSAAGYLMETSIQRHRQEEAIGYARRYIELTDSIEQSETDAMISEQEDILNAYHVEDMNGKLSDSISEKETTITVLSLACGILFVVAIILAYVCVRIRGRNKDSIPGETSALSDDLQSTVDKTHHDHTFDTDTKQRGETVDAGLQKLKRILMMKHLDPSQSIATEDFVWLERELDALLPGFIDRLMTLGLSERDFRDAMLVRLGLTTKDCSSVLGLSAPALSNARKKLLIRISPGKYDKWADYICSIQSGGDIAATESRQD